MEWIVFKADTILSDIEGKRQAVITVFVICDEMVKVGGKQHPWCLEGFVKMARRGGCNHDALLDGG